ncbi:MAG: putative glycoside hydrolase [Holosporales bacterium]|jgi:hypothetical protein|nr:putative glycoside hydrolase [Holosporales bacterium]
MLEKKIICFILKLSLILLAACENVEKPHEKDASPEIATHGEAAQEFYTGTQRDRSSEHATARGVYVGASDDILKRLADMKKFGVNAVVIDVKNEFGDITCDLDLPSLYKKSIRIHNIGKTIATLRSMGIYTIARIITFRDQYAVSAFDGFAVRNKDGSILVDREKSSWLNPYNKKVWDYVIQVAKAAAKIGFNEIQFDYVRFSSYKNPDIDLGPQSKSISRTEIISKFLDYAVRILHPLGVKISVDVFGCIIPGSLGEDTELATQRTGQDWNKIVKIVDYICPMIYPSHWTINSMNIKYPDHEPYKIINSSLQLAVKATESTKDARAIIRPWLQAFTANWLPPKVYMTYSKKQINEQLLATTDAGINGWCFWNPSARYAAFAW